MKNEMSEYMLIKSGTAGTGKAVLFVSLVTFFVVFVYCMITVKPTLFLTRHQNRKVGIRHIIANQSTQFGYYNTYNQDLPLDRKSDDFQSIHDGTQRESLGSRTSSDGHSSFESWQDITDETLHTRSHQNEDDFHTCPKRRPVIYTADGERQIPRELYKMAPKIFERVPEHFMKGMRMPCWKEGNDHTSCLPAFFLAGFPKAGTTDLWAKICRHPNVERVFKEPQYWTRRRINPDITDPWNEYLSNMTVTPMNNKLKPKLIIGDASASTIWDNHQWRDYFDFEACKEEGPPYIIADVLRTVLPKSKILVTLRNPTDRLYSDYTYFGRGALAADLFHKHVIRTIDWFNTCLQIASHRTCAYTQFKINDTLPSVRLNIGLYAIYVRDWLNVFPRDQLMFVRLEDWHEKCPEILPEVFKFLELDSLRPSTIGRICRNKIRNPTKTKIQPMFNETRKILDRFYLRTRQELAAVLADEKFLWN